MMIRIIFVQVPEQKTLFQYYIRDVIFPSTTSIHKKNRIPGSFSLYIVSCILDEQKNKQLKKTMILNTSTLKTNILQKRCYFHVWMKIIGNLRTTTMTTGSELQCTAQACPVKFVVVFPGEKCLRMRRDINHVVDFRQSHWLRDKIPAKCCQHERRNGSFFVSGSVVVLLPL